MVRVIEVRYLRDYVIWVRFADSTEEEVHLARGETPSAQG